MPASAQRTTNKPAAHAVAARASSTLCASVRHFLCILLCIFGHRAFAHCAWVQDLHGDKLLKLTEKLKQSEKREDLKVRIPPRAPDLSPPPDDTTVAHSAQHICVLWHCASFR